MEDKKQKLEQLIAGYIQIEQEAKKNPEQWYGTCYGKEIEKEIGTNYQ